MSIFAIPASSVMRAGRNKRAMRFVFYCTVLDQEFFLYNVSAISLSVRTMEIDKDARTWATVCHLSALIMLVGVPLGNILGPLGVWLAKRQTNEFVDDQGKEALNFQITFTLCEIVLFILIFLLVFGALLRHQPFAILPVIFHPAMLIMMALFILNIGLVIMAAIKSNEGISYRYPFTVRIVK